VSKFEEKREEIKNVGRKFFATYGYSKTTLEDIAESLKMKKNSLYYYFDSKEALFRELIEEEVKEHFKIQQEILARNIPADKKLLLSVEELIHFIHERTNKYFIKLSSYIEIEKIVEETFPDYKKKEGRFFREILNLGIEEGVFKKHNTQETAKDISFIIRSVIKNFYCNSELEFMREINFDEIFQKLKRIMKYVVESLKN
jgi:TetR/AcrR family transcriptional regulator